MSLYAITTEIGSIIDVILDGGADGTEASLALDAHLEGLDQVLTEKAESYAIVITELLVRAAARRDEATRIRDLAATDEALAERLKRRLKESMETTGRLKIDTPKFRLSVANNGGKQPLNITVPAEDLPEALRVVRLEANKDAIRAALEAGTAVPGCELAPRGTSLRIR